MNKIKNILMFFCIISVLMISHNAKSEETIEPFQIAAVQWLPDYNGSIASGGSGNSIEGNKPTKCSDFGSDIYSSVPDKMVCKKYFPKSGLACYKDCKCSSQFSSTTPCPDNAVSESCTDSTGTKYKCSITCGAEYNKTDEICQRENGSNWFANPSDVCGGKSKNCGCFPTVPEGYIQGTGLCPIEKELLTADDGCGTSYYKCSGEDCESGYGINTTSCSYGFELVTQASNAMCKTCRQKECSEGGFVSACPTGQTGTTVTWGAKTCYKDCKVTPTCEATVTCQFGCKKYCDGNCVECYPACTARYKYNFDARYDCYVRPYKIITQPNNPNCQNCECDNAGTDCGGRVCDCQII